jgi:hypothetical protein
VAHPLTGVIQPSSPADVAPVVALLAEAGTEQHQHAEHDGRSDQAQRRPCPAIPAALRPSPEGP